MAKQRRNYFALRMLAALLSLVLLVIAQNSPQRELSILNHPDFSLSIYSNDQAAPEESTSWIDQDQHHWQCFLQGNRDSGCGASLTFFASREQGFSFKGYHSIRYRMTYQGDGKKLRLFAQDLIPGFSTAEDDHSAKFMTAVLDPSEIKNGELLLPLHELTIAEWWKLQRDVPRKHSLSSYENIINLGISFHEAGLHRVNIEDISIVGNRLNKEWVYFGTTLFWLFVILGEGLTRIYILQKRSLKLSSEREKLSARVGKDPLTGLLNREGVDNYLAKLEAELKHQNIGVLVLDIDHFKRLNDQYGHNTGDLVLQEFSSIIKECVRENDGLARWGGEEFILICPDITPTSLNAVAEKIRALVEQHPFTKDTLKVTVSIGVSRGSPDLLTELIRQADTALYQAKREGRNQVAALQG